jgi:type VI secretion system protein VasD
VPVRSRGFIPLLLSVVKKMLPSCCQNLVIALLIVLFMMGCSQFSMDVPALGIKIGEKDAPPAETEPEVTKLDAAFTASPKLNQSNSGRASPLKVRLYELKSFRTFEKADFFSLDEDDQGTLGADLLGQEELQFKPNDARHYSRELQAETRYIGVIAAYRDINNARWRAIIKVKPLETTRVVVYLGAKAVSVKKLEEDGVSNEPSSQTEVEIDPEKSYDAYKKYKELL